EAGGNRGVTLTRDGHRGGLHRPWAAWPGALRQGSRGVGQQGQLARRLDGDGHLALVLGAVARHAASSDLPAVRDEPAQQVHVLVIDPVDVVLAEDADALLGPPRQVLGGPLAVAVAIAVAATRH